MIKLEQVVLFLLSVILISIISCKKDPEFIFQKKYTPIPYNLDIPKEFIGKNTTESVNNPMTEEGVKLGRLLFYDPILSVDSTISCSSCHVQENSFTDPNQFSSGVNGQKGNRNAMHITNVLWHEPFFWDGRATTLEDQALGPVVNPLEMAFNWIDAVKRIKKHGTYPDLFFKAFGTYDIDSLHVVKAIAQFERTFISSNSKWDQFKKSSKDPFEFFTLEEYLGYTIFFTEQGDCFHCHGDELMLTDNLFHNNGLDETFTDIGYETITNDPNDRGKFKTPSLRNVEFTAPYMHDGRFATLEEVVEHYSFGVIPSNTIDPKMKKVNQGGVQLSYEDRQNLIAFLKTFSDSTFINNKNYSSPF